MLIINIISSIEDVALSQSSLTNDGMLAPPSSEDPAIPWLEDVRAQRRAWEARWRFKHSLGTARQEAWESEVRKRRTARFDRLDQEWRYFRSLGFPQTTPFWWDRFAPNEREESATPNLPPGAPFLLPLGWNNLWYFRGF